MNTVPLMPPTSCFLTPFQSSLVSIQRLLLRAQQYQTSTTSEHLSELSRAIEAPRLKLFRRMNMAPDATPTLVKMRGASAAV